MKLRRGLLIASLLATALTTTSCCRYVRTAQDITPGNPSCTKMDWRYGASDIRIQTSKVTRTLMDRWYATSHYDCNLGKPRLIISDVDNRTDCYISTDMIRDIIESVAIDDGRFIVTVGDMCDEQELDWRMQKNVMDPKYWNTSQLQPGLAIAPQFLAKIRITKAVNADNCYDYEDYRMTITLYDIETQQAIDSAWDTLSKRVNRW